MLKSFFLILLFSVGGEALSVLLGGALPGNVLGLVALFAGLCAKIVKPDNVKPAAKLLTQNMALFFVPAAVGVIAYAEIFAKSFAAIASAIIISTLLTLATVALAQEHFEKRRQPKDR